MLIPAFRQRAGRPLRRSIRNVPTKSRAVAANEYHLRDPRVRDDSDDAQPTRVDLFDVKGCQREPVKIERRDRSYMIDEQNIDDNQQRRRIFAGNKTPHRWPALPSLFPSRTPTRSQHAEKQIGKVRGSPGVHVFPDSSGAPANLSMS